MEGKPDAEGQGSKRESQREESDKRGQNRELTTGVSKMKWGWRQGQEQF